jgi:predicted phosphoribosyltransferase
MFQNRIDAGKQLAERLKKYQAEDGIILAIPRGGVPIAYEVAQELGWPVDLMLTKKLGHPNHKEYAIGAIGLEERIVVPHRDVPQSYIESETEVVRNRLKAMRQKFMGDQPQKDVKGKTVIIVDDGIATGQTVLAAVEILRKQQPAKIIVAAPVAANRTVLTLSEKADDVVVVDIPENFYGVGQFYEDFTQVSDEEVIEDLKRAQGKS